ncbi:MAG: lipocalin-like domain-containing protein [Muribaculaceae bacterium]|nr:lipocalin-like domain-containing protein [Muribaculaceae bacterium]MDE7082034.1 lipocalin-like domain-containing protein [Muribaculaceae bacterium]
MHHTVTSASAPRRPRLTGAVTLLLLILAALATVGASCSRSNRMGKIHAMWQVMSIERPGEEPQTEFEPRLYYNFDQNVLQLTRSSDDTQSQGRYAANVSGEDPDYILDFPYDTDSYGMSLIRPWGIDENPVSMTVLELDNKTLVMRIGENVITCRRF